jgi:hypothetical protein
VILTPEETAANILKNGFYKQDLDFHNPFKILCHTIMKFCQNPWSLIRSLVRKEHSLKSLVPKPELGKKRTFTKIPGP